MMNENILKVLNNKAEYYPHKLEQQFPLILDKIIMMWDSPEFDSYFNKFMLDKREHARQGFPPDIASELMRLSMLHSVQFGTINIGSWIEPSRIKLD